MNKEFFELWERYFVKLAWDQIKVGDMSNWFSQGTEAWGPFMDSWRKVWGLNEVENAVGMDCDGKKFLELYTNMYQDFIKSFNVVSHQDYEELKEKYRKLEDVISGQESTIQHLRQLLAEKMADPSGMSDQFQKILKQQETNFQKFTDKMSKSVSPSVEGEKEKPKKKAARRKRLS
jgi:uncharacterized coiled-coil protein SlyX